MKIGIIYFTMNLVNGKTYVGQTTTCKKNEDHFGCNIYYGGGADIKKDIKEYGKEAFVRHTIEVVNGTLETLNNRETYWIQKLKPDYNKRTKCNGPGVGKPITEETRRKISEGTKKGMDNPEVRKRLRENNGMKNPDVAKRVSEKLKGRTFIDLHGKENAQIIKQKISKTLKGRIVTEETRKKIGDSNLGQKRSIETRQRISESQKGRKQSEETIKKKSDTMKTIWEKRRLAQKRSK